MERIEYGGWPNCTRLANAAVELIVTGDVGPRIIRFGPRGGANVFAEYPDQLGRTGGDEWRIYGGHRLWHAPESRPRTYAPDNQPISIEPLADCPPALGLLARQPAEPTTGVAKQIEVRLSPDAPAATVTHRLRNEGSWPIELAPWALSVMAPGGVGAFALPPRGSHADHLAPTSLLSLWAYTDLSDPRWTLGRRFILLRQDAAAAGPQKIGASAVGWVAYARGGLLFVKQFTAPIGPAGPDFGCSAEMFTDAAMLEIESLGPLTTLAPGATVEHVEHWTLATGVGELRTDADVERDILPRLAR